MRGQQILVMGMKETDAKHPEGRFLCNFLSMFIVHCIIREKL
jgi:hypothetical protein